jgi:hypothetical protein
LRGLGWTTQPLPPYESRCLLLGLEVLSDRRKIAGALFVRDSLCVRIESAYLADLKITLVRVQITLERVKTTLIRVEIIEFGHNLLKHTSECFVLPVAKIQSLFYSHHCLI